MALSEANCEFKLLTGLKNETEYSVWSGVIGNLVLPRRICEDMDCSDKMKSFLIEILAPVATKIGNKVVGEDASRSLLRGMILRALSSAEHQETINYGSKLMGDYLESGVPIDVDLVSFAYLNHGKNGGEKAFEQLKMLHQKTKLAEEKNRLESALANVSSLETMQDAVEYCLSEHVRDQDKDWMLTACSRNGKEYREKILDLTFEKMEYFKKIFGGMTIGSYLKSVLCQFQTHSKHDEIKKYFDSHPIKEAERSIQQGLEEIKSNAIFADREGNVIRDFLESK